jgi:hypothetical protein
VAYVPGIGEKDPEKVNRSIRNSHERLTTQASSVADIASSVAAVTTSVATLTTSVASLTTSVSAIITELSTISSFGARGIDCKNNAGTPNTQFDLDADEILLRDASGNGVVRIAPGAALTNNTATAGPAANGRDQAGAFANSTWLHFYWIWDGATLATVSSIVAPPTGPTLPTGYTHWAYAGADYKNSSGNLMAVRIKGSQVFYDTVQGVLNGGTATVSTAVDLAAFIPPNALTVNFASVGLLTTGAGGAAAENVLIGHVSPASSTFTAAYGVYVPVASQSQAGTLSFDMANVSRQLFYLWSNISGAGNVSSRELFIQVRGFRVPNGGE